MANDYFKFKQFTIFQDRCAMKVTTVACIQGAWLPKFSPIKILDIGSGTGLLTLMAAQEYNSNIDAIEIEDDAYGQLHENITQSPWNHRIKCYHTDIRLFAANVSNCYDFIICNPPFYENQLLSSDVKINHARHQTSLTIEALIEISIRLITKVGKISILLPPSETIKLKELCQKKPLFHAAQLVILDKEKKEPKAIVTILSKNQSKFISDKLIIKNNDGAYSSVFQSLLNPYYLYL